MTERMRTLGDPKGYTYTEAFRHECEVRYICALSTRQERAEYLAAIDKRRGVAVGDRLRADVRAEWGRLHSTDTPSPQLAEQAGEGGAVNLGGERPSVPDVGSFPRLPIEGNSNPVSRVVSGVGA